MWVAVFVMHTPFKTLALEGILLFKYTDTPMVQ